MAISLHSATVRSFLQILPQVSRMIDKAEAHCSAAGLGAETLTGARLADDMWNFGTQVTQIVHHSVGAINGVRAGTFKPDPEPGPLDFAALRVVISDAIAMLEAIDPAEVEAMIGRDTCFVFGERRMDFTVEDFLLSFTMPNFYFHATTAYAILRHNGLNVGKLDYIGRPRLKA